MRAPGLEIRLLGPVAVLRRGQPLQLPRSKKARALLAYLVATGQAYGRPTLCDLLWDGPSDPRAELRWSLSKIRPLLDDEATTRLVADQQQVGFEPGDCSIDLFTLRGLLPDAPATADTETLQRAAALLRGPFLEGLDLPACYRFDAWCVAERESLHQLHDAVLATLVTRLADDPEAALCCARDRIVLDPLSEDAHVELIKLLADLGRVDEARQRFERCQRMLAQEFGRRPSLALEGIRRSITHRKAPPQSQSRQADADEPAPEPLAGRQAECEQLDQFISEGRAGEPLGALAITGEPGIGKTRMLAALDQRVTAVGGLCIRGRAYEVEQVRPYAVWIDALRSLGTDRIPAQYHPDLAPLLPELGEADASATQRSRLFDAVAGLLCDQAEAHGLVVMVTDDLQWLDEASVALTHHVMRATTDRRVLFAAAGRSGELLGNAAVASLTRMLQAEGRVTMMELPPLDADATAQLAGRVAPGLDSQRVFAESDGNPLFIMEIARAMSRDGELVDETLADLIEARLSRLERPTRELIPWIAVLGRRFSLDVLAAVSKLPATALLPALTELEQQAVVQADRGGGYEFVHDIIRQVAYRRLSTPARAMIHLQIARELQRAMEREPVRASEVARHAEQGGDHELAVSACVLAGRHGLRLFAYEEVAASINRGLRLLDHTPEHKRIEMQVALLALYAHPGMKPYWPDDLEQRLWALRQQARAQGREQQFHPGYGILSMLHFQRGRRSDALALLGGRDHQDTPATPPTQVEALARTAACLGILGRQIPRARQLIQEADALVAEHGVTLTGCQLPLARGLVAHHDGDLDAARQALQQALALARSNDPVPWWEYYCLARLPMIELERGDPPAALAQCDPLAKVAARLGSGADAPFAAALQALSQSACRNRASGPAVDDALTRLREADSRGQIAYVQNVAAGQDLASGDWINVHARSQEALEAATVVEECSEAAIARARLAACSDHAATHLNTLAKELASPDRLSARATRIAEAALAAKAGDRS